MRKWRSCRKLRGVGRSGRGYRGGDFPHGTLSNSVLFTSLLSPISGGKQLKHGGGGCVMTFTT